MLACDRSVGRPGELRSAGNGRVAPAHCCSRGPLRTAACGFHCTGLKQALPARPSRSSSIHKGRPLVGSPPKRRLTCPRVLTLPGVVLGAHLTTSAPFRVRACARIRPVVRDGRRRASHDVPVSCRLSATGIRFLVILCPPGSWAFLTVGLPVLLPGPALDGVATFRAHELRPGWVPSLPRGLRCPHGRQVIPGRRTPPCSGPSLYPRPATHHRRLLITRHHQGFTVIHPSGLPLACGPGWSGSPRACPPRASHPAVTGGACRGGDRHRGHLPELRHHQLVLQSTQPLTACDLVSH